MGAIEHDLLRHPKLQAAIPDSPQIWFVMEPQSGCGFLRLLAPPPKNAAEFQILYILR